MTTRAIDVGHVVERKPRSELFGEYNLAAGRTGGLVLLESAAMPALVRLSRTTSPRGGRGRR
ncbi:MAG: hypothetical protein M3304_03480 [Actinomycetota bacterium]|nr:hypothetical protein [Actinomycetota bacterium]